MRMLSLIPKISWNNRSPGPVPPSGTAQYAAKVPRSFAWIVSYLVVAVTRKTVRVLVDR